VGFDKGLIEGGILLLTAKRSEKSPYGSSAKMVVSDVELLYPTIYLPLTAVLFDLGEPRFMEDTEISKVFPGPQMEKEAAA
jgi:hypothetical protein